LTDVRTFTALEYDINGNGQNLEQFDLRDFLILLQELSSPY